MQERSSIPVPALEADASAVAVRPSPLPPSHARTLAELVLHLAKREASSRHRFTLLGWLWPLARQLAQLGVLIFTFSKVLPLNVPNFPVFVFSGLVAWTWFAAGVGAATTSVVANRHLVFQSTFPTAVLPVIAVVVPLLDVLMALPVLIAMLSTHGELSWTLLFLPVIMLVQLILMCGVAWFVAAAHVFFRDVANVVGLVILLLFYVTPVFYERSRVGHYQWVLQINPMTTVIEAWRSVSLNGQLPFRLAFGVLAGAAALFAALGYLVYRRVQPGFVDEL